MSDEMQRDVGVSVTDELTTVNIYKYIYELFFTNLRLLILFGF